MSINNNVNESDDDIFFLFNDKKEKKNEKKIIQNIRTDKNNNFNLLNLDNNQSYSNKEKEELLKLKLEQEKEKNDIRNKLKCFICFGKVINATMCPFCKKLACEQCFKKILGKTKICSNCKSIVLSDELIKLPMFDDLTSFFINNIEQNYENENEEDKDKELIELKKQKCPEHPSKKIEYVCMNCNEFLCSESLLFFNKESVNKHNNHIILSFDDIEKFKLYKIIKEYKSLPENRDRLNIKINNYKKSIKEIEKRKKTINYIYNTLKGDLQAKYEKKISNLKSILNSLKNRKREITNMIQNPPNLIVELNDQEKGKNIINELKNLNNIWTNEEDLENETKFKKEIKCEQYESEPIEIKLPNNDQYIEEYTVIKTELNFMPNLKCKFNCQLLLNNFILTLILEVDKTFINQHYERFIGYLYLENNDTKKVVSLQGYLSNKDNELVFSTQYDFNEIKEMINKDNRCFCRFNITKFNYK